MNACGHEGCTAMMRRFAGSSTSALLQRASAQLSGGKVTSTLGTTAATVDDDGLAVSFCCHCGGSCVCYPISIVSEGSLTNSNL